MKAVVLAESPKPYLGVTSEITKTAYLFDMAKDPAFLFYSDNFQSGTQFFTNAQAGKYIRLICAQHQHGHLTEKQMLFICGEKDAEIWAKFRLDNNGFFYNERLDFEIEKRQNFTKSRRKNGLKGGRPTDKKSKKSKAKPYGYPTDNHIGNGNGIGNEDRKGKENGNSATIKSEQIGEPKTYSLHYRMQVMFLESYLRKTGLNFAWDGKSARNLKEVIPKIETKIGTKDESEVMKFWETLIENIPDWQFQNNFSPAGINSRINEIVQKIHKPNATNNSNIDRQVAEILSHGNPYARKKD